jgi:transcriptional regulator NrdR family protein
MKCPTCGAWSLVKETRQSPTFGQTRRRECMKCPDSVISERDTIDIRANTKRECANEHRFTTQEVIIPQEIIDEERRTHIENNLKRLESIRASRPTRVRKSNASIY